MLKMQNSPNALKIEPPKAAHNSIVHGTRTPTNKEER